MTVDGEGGMEMDLETHFLSLSLEDHSDLSLSALACRLMRNFEVLVTTGEPVDQALA